MAFPLETVVPSDGAAVPAAVSLELLTTMARQALSPETIPDELKALAQWVCWRYEERPNGTVTKPPYQCTGGRAQTNNPATWSTFEAALAAFNSNPKFAGIGLCLSADDGLVFIDIDDYGDAPDPLASMALDWFGGSYAETSPSGGHASHVFCFGKLPGKAGTKVGMFEAYQHPSNRYLTITGQRIDGHPLTVTVQQDAIDKFYRHCLCKEPLPTPDPDMPDFDAMSDAEIDALIGGSDIDGLSVRCPQCGEPAEYPDCAACGYDLTQTPDTIATDTEKNEPVAPPDRFSFVSVASVDYADRLRLAIGNAETRALYAGELCGRASRSEAEQALCFRLMTFADGRTDIVAGWMDASGCTKWLDRGKDSDVYRSHTLAAAVKKWDGVCFVDKRQEAQQHGAELAAALLKNRQSGADDRQPGADDEPSADEKPSKLRVCDTTNLRTATLPPPQFIVNPLIPRGHLTLFGGHGGSGKTTVSLVMAAHVACGADWSGLAFTQGKVLIVSFEDDEGLLLWRLKNIIEEYGLDFDAVTANLTVIDATEADAMMWECSPNGVRTVLESADGKELATLITDNAFDLVVIDNASDAFDGDENNRRQVRRFVRFCANAVKPHNGAIVLLAHIDKSAARYGASGNSYSGSTGWHNSARSRLALVDNELRQEKLNVGKVLPDPIPLVWTDRAVPIPADSTGALLAQSLIDGADDKALLSCFDVAASIGDTVPAAEAGTQTAYRLFTGYPEGKAFADNRPRFQAGMTRLQRAGKVRKEAYRNESRKEKTRLVRVNPD